MQDYLKDIVQHTNGLGNIDLIKITGTDTETLINSVSEDRSVILEAKFKSAHPDFIGTFGMPNLGKLKIILGIDEYRENAKITINTQQNNNGDTVPCGIHFENAAGDFKNDYRYMDANVVNEKLKTVKFKGVTWGVDFEPTAANVQRLRFMASANSDDTTFTAKTDSNNNLLFYFGDPTTHAGNFVFSAGITGSFTKTSWHWPVHVILAILALPGDKTMKMSDAGASKITVDSGLIEYDYIIPAQTK
jgi:hypothetical protein